MRARGSLGNGRDVRLLCKDSGRGEGGKGNLRGKDVRLTRAERSELMAKSLAITVDKVGNENIRPTSKALYYMDLCITETLDITWL